MVETIIKIRPFKFRQSVGILEDFTVHCWKNPGSQFESTHLFFFAETPCRKVLFSSKVPSVLF